MAGSGFCIDEELVGVAREIIEGLRRSKLTLVTAESCTGGLIAAALSHGPRASECLHGGFVVYTKTHKNAALDVSQALLEQRGSVCSEVAAEMAAGALAHSPAELSIAVTGVLGPDHDEDGNPPGLVYLATARRGERPRVVAQHFSGGDPDQVRRAVVLQSFALIKDRLSG